MSEPVYCPRCHKRMRVRTSKRIGEVSYGRYYECACGGKAKRTIEASKVWQRPGRAAANCDIPALGQ